MYGLTHCRGVVSAHSFLTRLGFDSLPEWQEVRSRPFPEQKRLLRDPEIRRRLVFAAHHGDYGSTTGPEAGRPKFDKMTILESAYLPNPTVAEVAERRGVDPVEAMIDIALERDFDVFFLQKLVPQDDEMLLRLMKHPRTAMCFSDSGAHVSQVFDSSIYSHLLAYWVREREELTLEEAVQMVTSRPADIWRLRDRGRLAPRLRGRYHRVRPRNGCSSHAAGGRRSPWRGEANQNSAQWATQQPLSMARSLLVTAKRLRLGLADSFVRPLQSHRDDRAHHRGQRGPPERAHWPGSRRHRRNIRNRAINGLASGASWGIGCRSWP